MWDRNWNKLTCKFYITVRYFHCYGSIFDLRHLWKMFMGKRNGRANSEIGQMRHCCWPFVILWRERKSNVGAVKSDHDWLSNEWKKTVWSYRKIIVVMFSLNAKKQQWKLKTRFMICYIMNLQRGILSALVAKPFAVYLSRG